MSTIDWLEGVSPKREMLSGSLNEGLRTERPAKPPYSYATLIARALTSTPTRMMTLSEIYSWIQRHYAYYRMAGNGWKNSVRHNLSINKQFMKIPRARDDPGKGHYWAVNPAHVFHDKRHRSCPLSRFHGYAKDSWTASELSRFEEPEQNYSNLHDTCEEALPPEVSECLQSLQDESGNPMETILDQATMNSLAFDNPSDSMTQR